MSHNYYAEPDRQNLTTFLLFRPDNIDDVHALGLIERWIPGTRLVNTWRQGSILSPTRSHRSLPMVHRQSGV